MKKSMYKTVFLYCLITLFAILLIDYFNIPSSIGLQMNSLNYSLLETLLNVLVVIALYIITYNKIDKRQIEKDENAKQTANYLILSAYKQCIETLKLVNNREMLEDYVVTRIDFDKIDINNKVTMNLIDSPFSEHSHILDLAAAGAIYGSDLSTYYEIMDLYKSYLSKKIAFLLFSRYFSIKSMKFENSFIKEYEDINMLINKEIERLEKEIKGYKNFYK